MDPDPDRSLAAYLGGSNTFPSGQVQVWGGPPKQGSMVVDSLNQKGYVVSAEGRASESKSLMKIKQFVLVPGSVSK